MADLFAYARPDAELEDRMIRGLRKVRVPFRWSMWMRFAAGTAAVVMLGVVGAVVQAVAAGGSFPGVDRESAARTQSVNDLKRLATTFYHREDADKEYKDVLVKVQETRTGSLMLGDVSGSMTLADSDLYERLGDASVSGKHDPNQALALDDSRSAGGTVGFNGTTNLGVGRTLKGAGAGNDQGKAEQDLDKQGAGWSEKRGFKGTGGDGREFALRLGGVEKAKPPTIFFPEMPSGLTSAGTLTPGTDGANVGGGASNATLPQMRMPGVKSPEVAYFKPSDGPASPGEAGKPGVDAPQSAGVSGPPRGTNPPGKSENKNSGPYPVGDLVIPVATQPKQDPPAADSGLKISRTGEMEFEVDRFDKAVDAVMALLKPLQTKGDFKLKEDSTKQANGKTRGHVVVRMPPQFLDDFVLDLRRELAKVGELKLQQIGSQDVTKVFTDTESELKAARAVEKRLLAIIENGKGDVKDLVAAEKELGAWRTKIEKMEGEIRYYSNQVALSTLTITLVEKEITAAAALVVNETVKMRVEVDNVSRARETAEKAVEEFKGRIVKSDEKQYPAGQVEAIIHAEIKPERKEDFRRLLEKLGIVSAHEDAQSQTTEGGTAPILTPRRRVNDVLFQVTLNNIVNVKPKQSIKLDIVSTDVRSNFEKLKDEIIRVFKGQIRDAKLDENQDKQKAIATIDFSVPTEKKAEMDKLLAGIGPTLDRVNSQAAITEIFTEQKFGYQLTLYSIATVEPRKSSAAHRGEGRGREVGRDCRAGEGSQWAARQAQERPQQGRPDRGAVCHQCAAQGQRPAGARHQGQRGGHRLGTGAESVRAGK